MVMADEYFDYSYTKALENIFDNEKGLRKERARVLLDNYRKASCWLSHKTRARAQGGDRKRAKDWETERKSGKMSGGPLINIQNSTVSGSGTIYINAGTSNIDVSKK
ncbi:8972_t:CDS:2 [Rhizophagus irregularis]|nr:8972_t:CDS:2 [Rhizophagus irregularis]